MLTDDAHPPPPGLRARHKARTRQALLDAAIELFTRDGYEETTVTDITTHADVSPRTFFRYFNSKDEILYGDQTAREARLATALAERPVDEPRADFRRAVVGLLAEESIAVADRVTLLTRIVPDSAALMDGLAGHHRRIVLIIARHLRSGRSRDATDPLPRAVAAQIVTVWETETVRWIEGGHQGDLATLMLDQLARLCARVRQAEPSG